MTRGSLGSKAGADVMRYMLRALVWCWVHKSAVDILNPQAKLLAKMAGMLVVFATEQIGSMVLPDFVSGTCAMPQVLSMEPQGFTT